MPLAPPRRATGFRTGWRSGRLCLDGLAISWVSVMQNHGVKDSALGTAAAGDRVPEWLEKWASLILRFVEEERALLPAQLCAIPPPTAFYTPTSAEIEARGGTTLLSVIHLRMEACTAQSAHDVWSKWLRHLDSVLPAGTPLQSRKTACCVGASPTEAVVFGNPASLVNEGTRCCYLSQATTMTQCDTARQA